MIPDPQPAPQMALPTAVQIGAVETVFNVDVLGVAAHSPLIAVRTQTPCGVHVALTTSEGADQLAHLLKNAAARARSGLIVPAKANGHDLGIGGAA